MKVLFLDTNFFLQCKVPDQLPWREFSPTDNLTLLVCKPVLAEIDILKSDGNSRRARRARKANSFLREILLSSEQMKILHEVDPRVELKFSPPLAPGRISSPHLDLTKVDEQIINDALAYKMDHPHQVVSILTNDTGPLLTAKLVNLPSIVIPDDWILPPESDPIEKENKTLKEELKKFQRLFPEIKVAVYAPDGQIIQNAKHFLGVTVFPPLNQQFVAEFMDNLRRCCPLETNFGPEPAERALMLQSDPIYKFEYVPAPEKEIKDYEEAYKEWIESVPKFLENFPSRLESIRNPISFLFILQNEGHVPVEDMIVEFKALGGFLFPSPKDDDRGAEQDQLLFPVSPRVPKGKLQKKSRYNFDFGLSDIINAASMVRPEFYNEGNDLLASITGYQKQMDTLTQGIYRDRNTFYWKSRPKTPDTCWSFECERFNHRIQSEKFVLPLILPTREIRNGAIQCTVSAKNLPEPFLFNLSISINYKEGNTVEELLSLHPQKSELKIQTGQE